jgi:hypothetical protein
LGIAGFFEEKTQLAFRFAYPFGETIGAFAHKEGWQGRVSFDWRDI